MIGERVLTLLARDLVDEQFGGKPVGDEADAAQRVGAHAGVAIELLHQLVRRDSGGGLKISTASPAGDTDAMSFKGSICA